MRTLHVVVFIELLEDIHTQVRVVVQGSLTHIPYLVIVHKTRPDVWSSQTQHLKLFTVSPTFVGVARTAPTVAI